MPDQTTTPGLEYGQKIPFHRRSIARRALVAVITIAAAIWSVNWIARKVPRLIHTWQLYDDQRQCVGRPIPPGTPVYSSGPPLYSRPSPDCDKVIAEYRAYVSWRYATIPKSVAVYLGRRQASNGVTRFLAVTATVVPYPKSVAVGFNVLNRPLKFNAPEVDNQRQQMTPIAGWAYSQNNPRPPSATVYAATEDPKDPSRFTITCDINNWRYVLDCSVQADGHVHMIEHFFYWRTLRNGARDGPYEDTDLSEAMNTPPPDYPFTPTP